MMSKRIALKVFSLFFTFLTFCVSPSSWATVMGEEHSAFNFRFNNPGARSNAMGGAFICLADDATAAFANPAGLTILTKPEFSVEYKHGEVTSYFPDDFGTHEYDETFSGISFLSYVHPLEKTSVAVFRHQLINQEANFVRHGVSDYSIINVEQSAVTYGISVGHEMTDTFSLGISVGFDQLDWNLLNTKYFTGGPADQNAERISSVDDTAYAEHYTASVLWNPFGELNLGLVYRMGPKFETIYEKHLWDSANTCYIYSVYEQILKIPDVWGIGISYRFFPNFTTVLDVNYVEYSDLYDDVRDSSTGDDISDEWSIDDEVEIHIGFEYIFDINKTPFAIRAGYYYLPGLNTIYSGTNPVIIDIVERMTENEDHIFSLGFGAVFNNFQIDVAGSAGDFIKEITTSIVFRFD